MKNNKKPRTPNKNSMSRLNFIKTSLFGLLLITQSSSFGMVGIGIVGAPSPSTEKSLSMEERFELYRAIEEAVSKGDIAYLNKIMPLRHKEIFNDTHFACRLVLTSLNRPDMDIAQKIMDACPHPLYGIGINASEILEQAIKQNNEKKLILVLNKLLKHDAPMQHVTPAIQLATKLGNLTLRDLIFSKIRRRGQVKALTSTPTKHAPKKFIWEPSLAAIFGFSDDNWYLGDNDTKGLLHLSNKKLVNVDTRKKITDALSESIAENDAESVRLLFEAYGDTTINGENILKKDLALATAIEQGKKEVVQFLLSKQSTLNKKLNGYTPLTLATEKQHIDLVKMLLKKGADVNFIKPNIRNRGVTALMLAARHKNVPLVQLLLSYRADVNKEDKHGLKAIDYVMQNYHDKEKERDVIIDLLIKNGDTSLSDLVKFIENDSNEIIQLNQRSEKLAGLVPLIQAVRRGNEQEVNGLLKLPETLVNKQDHAGRTALMEAVTTGNTAIAKILLNNSADMNIQDLEGNTALSLAKNNAAMENLLTFCVICQDHQNKKTTTLSCNHEFHEDCINLWLHNLQNQHLPSTCPTCRTVIIPQDA